MISWKKGGWYWRFTGQYAGRAWAAAIWFLWIVATNYLIYPILEQSATSLYTIAGEANATMIFLITTLIWAYMFIWKGQKTSEM